MSDSVLSIRDLSIEYRSREGTVYAATNVSLDVRRGRVTALVGESGSGKTSIAHSVLQLLPGNAQVTSGIVRLHGQDLLKLKGKELREIRGRSIAMIFQDASAGLNPVLKVGDQVAEVLINHLEISKKEAQQESIRLLKTVGLTDPRRIAESYPFQLSGGMCQRVMVAIATALEPDVLIADEPTSSLDVTVQAQVLYELEKLSERHGTGILLITHNLGVVAQVADEVAVMYSGVVVEHGPTMDVMSRPLHPYTHGLLGALPRLDHPGSLQVIGGELPDARVQAEHCVFLSRCNKVLSRCRQDTLPALSDEEGAHRVACYNPIWHSD